MEEEEEEEPKRKRARVQRMVAKDKSNYNNFPLTDRMKEKLKEPFKCYFDYRKSPPPLSEIKITLIDAGLRDEFVNEFDDIPPAKVLTRIANYVRQCIRNNLLKKKKL